MFGTASTGGVEHVGESMADAAADDDDDGDDDTTSYERPATVHPASGRQHHAGSITIHVLALPTMDQPCRSLPGPRMGRCSSAVHWLNGKLLQRATRHSTPAGACEAARSKVALNVPRKCHPRSCSRYVPAGSLSRPPISAASRRSLGVGGDRNIEWACSQSIPRRQ